MLNGKQSPSKTSWGRVRDELKSKLNLQTDVELASFLDVNKAFISAVRGGKRNISVRLGERIFASMERDLSPDEYAIFMPVRITSRIQARMPNPHLLQLVRGRAGGHCEYCGNPAPFKTAEGEPYLEVHHLRSLARGGKDDFENLVALCPNCHRRMHIDPPVDSMTFLATKGSHGKR